MDSTVLAATQPDYGDCRGHEGVPFAAADRVDLVSHDGNTAAKNPRVPKRDDRVVNRSICRPFMPEEGLEPPTHGL